MAAESSGRELVSRKEKQLQLQLQKEMEDKAGMGTKEQIITKEEIITNGQLNPDQLSLRENPAITTGQSRTAMWKQLFFKATLLHSPFFHQLL